VANGAFVTIFATLLWYSGLVEINPLGETFDLNRDEATEYVPVEKESEHHKIIGVIQKGYTLNGKAMRPPKVKVGEFKNQG
jgi:molecular chaperone GrpE